MMKQFVCIILFCLSAGFSQAQLQTTYNKNPDSLAAAVAGSGMVISNATLNCPDSASGYFNGAASNIGIAKGVLLTTGDLKHAVGPNNLTGAGTSHNVTYQDSDLINIVPVAMYDVCILEFDGVPSCDSVFIKFAFGSEEYPEFSNSTTNDAFGLFVTGPNPSGPAYSGYNMALIPSTTMPVTINNVNNGTACPTTGPCQNCAYYVDNCTGTTVQYDGFTTVIQRTLYTVPSQSYHFKFAIADAGDWIFDSGVFIDVGSFGCMVVTASTTPDTCGNALGTATATMLGGTPPFTYAWSNGQTTQTATGLTAGNYSVVVTDSTLLTSSAIVTVINIQLSGTTTVTPVSCSGPADGTASVTMNNGTPPFTYAWSNGQTTQTATGLAAGNYSVSVSDSSGCISTFAVSVVTAQLAGTTTVTPVSCAGSSDATATVTIVGGIPPFTYAWSNGQTTQTATGLAAGNYNVTVTDSSGCSGVFSVNINPGAAGVSLSVVNNTPASCPTCPDGSATVFPFGGTSPYTFSWSPGGQTTGVATGLLPGSHTVCVTDSKGCSMCTTVNIGALGINENISNAVSIYPNPSSGSVVLDFGVRQLGPTELIITNLVGLEIRRTTMDARGKKQLDLSELPSGVYFISLYAESGWVTKKLTISR